LLELIARGFGVPLSALVGGPWTWAGTGQSMSVATPPVAAFVLGGLVAVVVVMTAWRRDRRALLLWASVAVYVLVTVLLVSYGRFRGFGSIFTVHYHYWSDLSIPLTLAVVLSLRTVQVRLVAVPIACLVVGVVISNAGFAREWGKNPAKAYFATVTAELDRAGPSVNLWDTPMPRSIATALMADTRLSPVLRMARIPFQLQAPTSEPLLVDDTGHLRPSQLAVWSRGEPASRSNSFCNLLVRGTDPVTVPLVSTQLGIATSEWFVKAAYFSNRENTVAIELLDADGKIAALPAATGPLEREHVLRPVARITATHLRLRSSDPATNLCIENLEIGLPR
jgi:hypothetical protein